jgi:cell division protein FtsI/penicillin-binding protein 2
MITQFPIDDFASPRRRGPRRFRLRYLLLALILVGLSLFFLPDGRGGSEVIPAKGAALTRKDLCRIDQDAIRRYNLTINQDLQQFVAENAAKYRLHYGTIVVMDARTGDILVMYGQGPQGQDCALCLDANHAASIFKIVTAVAAMDQGGYTGGSLFSYTGSAHTLYRNQLLNRRDRWTADITLADAFAHSNNVVFAKIGTTYLGETPILLTAMKMGFWKSPLKDVECTPSTLFFPEDEYNLAELTSGFNRRTKISPVHAAQMASAAVNRGTMVTPRLVRGREVEKVRVMGEDTAYHLSSMMERTIRSGTLSREFRNTSSDRVLRNLTIGAKSGSIDGDEPRGRRNWFVGFARNEATGEAITIGCLLVLDDYFWIQADTLSRLIIRRHFSNQLGSVARSN